MKPARESQYARWKRTNGYRVANALLWQMRLQLCERTTQEHAIMDPEPLIEVDGGRAICLGNPFDHTKHGTPKGASLFNPRTLDRAPGRLVGDPDSPTGYSIKITKHRKGELSPEVTTLPVSIAFTFAKAAE